MEMLGKVRRMHYRDGLSHSEISRRTGLSRNTVKKWLKAPDGASPAYRRESTPGKLGPYRAALIQALEADTRRPRRDRRSAKALLAELRGLGYTGGYTVLTDFIRDWRLGAGANPPSRAFVPLKFALGEAFQFDWSEEGLVIGGVWRKLLVAHPRRFERGQTCYDWRHYLSVVERKPGALRNGAPFAGMPESLIRLQRLLLKRDGGDRAMSQMLAVVPTAGLEAVLVTTALLDRLTHHCHIIETGNDSWRFQHSSAVARSKIKTREKARRAPGAVEEAEPF